MTYAVLPDRLGAPCTNVFSCAMCLGETEHPGCECFDKACEVLRGIVPQTGETHLLVRRSEVLIVREPRVVMGPRTHRLAS